MLVKQLEAALFAQFPAQDAEEWDRVGLTCGDQNDTVKGIACALDPTPDSVMAAAQAGCNVLLTHHPAYLDPPQTFSPQAPDSSQAGATVFQASRLGVSLIGMHTNLDRSKAALKLFGTLCGRTVTDDTPSVDGFGAIVDASNVSVDELARICSTNFGVPAQVWGSGLSRAGSTFLCSGSLGDLGTAAANQGCTCVIAGECGYHRLLDLNYSGVAVILLGHDGSEQPFAQLLASAARTCCPDVDVRIIEENPHWHIAGLER